MWPGLLRAASFVVLIVEAVMANGNQWLTVDLQPCSLFSLRSSYATSKGGKSLLVPTPYAVKMALLDACFRAEEGNRALALAYRVFDLVKGKPVRFRPPQSCVVQNTFVRALQPARGGSEESGPDSESGDLNVEFSRTIMYREFVFHGGQLTVALGVDGVADDGIALLRSLFFHINQLGKRGSFWQVEGVTLRESALPAGFSVVKAELEALPAAVAASYRVAQYLDDYGPDLCSDRHGFDRVSTYGAKDIAFGKHRTISLHLLPYVLARSGRHFSEYRRVEQE